MRGGLGILQDVAASYAESWSWLRELPEPCGRVKGCAVTLKGEALGTTC